MNKYQEALDNIADELIECGRTKDLNGETILKEQTELNLLQELANKADEQSVVPNSDEFLHFKLHSDSTLKSQTKDYLVDYIHMLYHNWEFCDKALYNMMTVAKIIDEALDKACRQLEKESTYRVNTDYYDETSFMDRECWREWCLKDE